MRKKTTIAPWLAAIAVAVTLLPLVVNGAFFPGSAPSKQLQKKQEKAHSLFEKGKFDRSMTIYRDDLAVVGDKYAQYMVGYMYFTGKGIQQDQIIASAWYRLAAERDEPSYMKVRDSLLNLLSPKQRARSDSIFFELRKEYGDARLLRNLVEEDLEFMRQRVKSDKFNIDSLGRRNYDRHRDAYNATVVRLEVRLSRLQQMMLADSMTSDDELRAFEDLRQQASIEAESLAEYNRMAPP